MKLLITGDFVINRPYYTSQISDEIKKLFAESNYNIVNLEAPVTSSNTKIIKTGPHLKANKESTLSVLKALEIDLVTLANNHVLDYDEEGVLDTLEVCKENNIKTVGAGKNKEEAAKVFYLASEVGKIAFINIAENEWASATETSAGANGMDIIEDVKTIQEAKQKSDFVFVIVHGGHEYYNLPSPRMQKQYRFYIDNGADLVVGHHTHCIGGMETYKGKSIYYSLGNFLFTKLSSHEDWYTGLILEVEINNGKIISQIHPVKQEKETFRLELTTGKEKGNILKRIDAYNDIIKDEARLGTQWNKYVNSKYISYLNYWSPLSFVKNRYIKGILRRLKLKMINKNGLALTLNLMRCEAHSDMSKEVVTKYLNN